MRILNHFVKLDGAKIQTDNLKIKIDFKEL